MRIGIHASNTRSAGGQFQFLLMFLDGLRAQTSLAAEIVLLFFSDEQQLAERYADSGWQMVEMAEAFGFNNTSSKDSLKIRRDVLPRLPEMLRQQLALDFLFFPTWTENCHQWGLPFAFIVHDLQHRLQPEFPEVALGKDGGASWQWREEFFSAAFGAAQFAIVDSEVGQHHATEFYGLPKERIAILPPTLPVVRTPERKKLESVTLGRLPQEFFFYPAQFWPHKNHYRVVEALGLLKKNFGIERDVVFTGGTFPEWPIRENCEMLAKHLGIVNRVHFYGYVSDSDIAQLYEKALALVMPTFFGPANIPYVEAFAAGCPVIAADISGIREQIGNAGLLVDPRDSHKISAAMKDIATNSELRQSLRERGKKRFVDFSPQRFAECMAEILRRVV